MKILGRPRKNDHFWTWLPELGQDYQFCDRCNKVEHIDSGRRMTYEQALKEVAEGLANGTLKNKPEPQEKGAGK